MLSHTDTVITKQMQLINTGIRWLLIAVASVSLLACDGKSNTNVSSVVLDITTRELLSINDSTLQVDIRVNGGQVQTFSVGPGEAEPAVAIAGVRIGESNSIEIKWSEILNGHQVELAIQNQTFVADGNHVIDSDHSSDQFDYDGDGKSNLDERYDGTCIWSADESCTPDTDIPVTSQVQTTNEGPLQINLDNATVLIDSDFSNGRGLWFSFLPVVANNMDFCVTFPADVPNRWLFLSAADLFFDVPKARYALQFDIRASRGASVLSSFYHEPTNSAVFEESFSVSQSWETKNVSFEHFGDTFSGVTLGFNALTTDFETTYCFDNIKLFQLNN